MSRLSLRRVPKRALIALIGIALVGGVAGTAASFVDSATVNLGGTGIGNPNRFTLQVRDVIGAWKDADTEADAVLLPTTPDGTISTQIPIGYQALVRIAPESPAGDITPRIYAPADCSDVCRDLFDGMRFTVSIDDAPVASAITAAEFNALPERVLTGVTPGDLHKLSLTVLLDPNTPFAMGAKQTTFGVVFEGITT